MARTEEAPAREAGSDDVRPRAASLEERLARLEVQQRRLRRTTLALAVALSAAVLLLAVQWLPRALGAGAGGGAGVVQARGFTVLDAAGRTRASLGVGEASGGPELLLHDAAGAARLRVGLGADGSPLVRLAGAGGESLADLSVYGSEGVRLGLSSPGGADFFSVGSHPDGSARLALADALGRPRAVLVAGAAAPGLELMDRRGVPRARLSLGEADAARLVLEGSGGTRFQAPD
jgi:hypothetical protein